jgi:hypothetical protein
MRTASAVAARDQEPRPGVEDFSARHEELERIGEPIGRVEREADGERVLDLLARSDANGKGRGESAAAIYDSLLERSPRPQ